MKTLRKRPWALLLTTLLLMLSLTIIGCGGDEPVENDPETAGVTDDDEEEGQSEDEAQAADGEDEADADEVDEEAEDDSEAETDADADTATAEDEEADADEPAAGTDTDSDQADESEGDEGETAVSPADAGYTPNFTSSSCDFIVPGGRDVTCGYLTVPEDRTQPDGAAVRLHVAVFLSESGNPAPDPVVYLEGGPGGEPLETLIFTFEDYFAPYLTERDVIIFDQRGTGLSEPSLACPELVEASLEYLDDVLSDEEEADVYLGAMTDCRERLLADGVNLAAYNSRENAADLNDLRIALGYDEWNLYGISYGTKLALTTMRDFPEGIRSVVLDSAYPLQTSLIIDVPANMDRAFDTLFAGCATDPVCDEAYPNLEETFYATVAQLDETPQLIEVSDFFKGERYEAVATGDILVASLFQALYSAEIIPALPKMIYDTAAGDYQLLSLLASNAISQQEFISHGMNTSVQCHEEVIFDTPEDADAAVAPFPELVDYFGDTTLDFALCDLWEAGSATAVENEPVSSDIPTLVLAGEYDPITPPAFGLLAAETLPNSYYYEFPGLGHGVSVSGDCPQGMTLAFIDDPVTAPDDGCIADLGAPAFEVPVAEGEAAEITFVPFTSDIGTAEISGVVPEGWEDFGFGTFIRGENGLDQTTLLLQGGPGISTSMLRELVISQLGIEGEPEDRGEYEDANGRTWTLNGSAVQGLPVIFALAETETEAFFVLLLGNTPEELDALLETLLYPVLDALEVVE